MCRANDASQRTNQQHHPITTNNGVGTNHQPIVSAEVIGATGRIGSLFLRSSTTTNNTTPVAVPKGVSPGSLSPQGTPIYVATPAQAWPLILEDTPTARRSDLVWIGNGLPPSSDVEGTVVVPHFGVLQVHADPVTSPDSPPTFVFGKHAAAVQRILHENGIVQVDIVNSYPAILAAAAQKLLWAASMWLLCHSSSTTPRTALQVHNTALADTLDELVRRELFPALCQRLPEAFAKTPQQCNAALDYMYQYSKSMPKAIPNLELGRQEWKERNAFFLQADGESVVEKQRLHVELLQLVGGISVKDIEDAVSSPSCHDGNPQNDFGLCSKG